MECLVNLELQEEVDDYKSISSDRKRRKTDGSPARQEQIEEKIVNTPRLSELLKEITSANRDKCNDNMKFQQDIVDRYTDQDKRAKLEFNSAADQVNAKGVLLKMMLTILHENQILKNNVSSDGIVHYRSYNLSFCSREESKYYCKLELCLHV